MSERQDFGAAMQASIEQARKAGASYIGTEHLLLGVLQQEEADVTRLLAANGVTYQAVYAQYVSIFLTGTHSGLPAPSPPTGQGMPAAQLLQLTPKAAQAVSAIRPTTDGSRRLTELVAALFSTGGISTGLVEAAADAQGLSLEGFSAEIEQQVRALLRGGEPNAR